MRDICMEITEYYKEFVYTVVLIVTLCCTGLQWDDFSSSWTCSATFSYAEQQCYIYWCAGLVAIIKKLWQEIWMFQCRCKFKTACRIALILHGSLISGLLVKWAENLLAKLSCNKMQCVLTDGDIFELNLYFGYKRSFPAIE